MKKLIVISTLVCSNAFAWGPREQSALLGLAIGAGAVALSQQDQSQPRHHRQPQYQPPAVVYQPQQQICGYNVLCAPVQREVYVPTCHMESQVDYYGRVISTYQVCR